MLLKVSRNSSLNWSDGGSSKTTEEMIQQGNFTPEWNFNEIWEINEDTSYPYLQWQGNENIPTPTNH